MELIREASPRFKARMAGVFYLLNGGAGFAFFIRNRLVVSGDAAATAVNILAHEHLFRSALAADLLGVAAYVVVTSLLFFLFKPVNNSLSFVAAILGIVGYAIQAFACVFDLASLSVLGTGQSLSTCPLQQSQTLVLMLLRLQGQGFSIAILFFGFYCFLIGYLVFKSMFMPRLIGVLMALGGLAYLANSLAIFLLVPLPMVFSHLVPALGGLEELSLMIWLLVVGAIGDGSSRIA
jgi:hypothetical protein